MENEEKNEYLYFYECQLFIISMFLFQKQNAD